MKPDEDNCWYLGRHEFCKATYPGQYEWCSASYHRCVECTDHTHCPPERPWCDWDMECEECLVSVHCATGESCLMRNGHWVCRVKDCVDYRDEGDYDYCANNFRGTPLCDIEKRRCVECIVPSDCEGERETCIASKCVDESEMDCVQQIEAGFLNYCSVTFPERPICHTRLRDCVECEFNDDCSNVDDEGKRTDTCEGIRCIPKEWECEGPEDCLSDRYKCVQHECILKDCSDYDNPDAFCAEKRPGWRCLDKICVRCIGPEDCHEGQKCANNKCVDKTCDERSVPDWWCRDHFGGNFKCIDKECKDVSVKRKCSEFLFGTEAEDFCEKLDPLKPYCDFSTGTCVECNHDPQCTQGTSNRCFYHKCVECYSDRHCDSDHKCDLENNVCIRKTCADLEDDYCERRYGLGYICENEECVATGCSRIDTRCPEGYYCPENECIWGCRDKTNCPEAKPYCSAEGSCVECIGPVHCGIGYDCKDYMCIKQADCLHQDGLCPKNEYCNVDHCEEGCRDSRNCAETTPHCSLKTGKCEVCVFNRDCDRGYECDNYNCVWVGYDCSFDPECPKNWYCSNHFCVFGCNNSDENCAKETPHCSLKTGKCEECWSPIHCEWWQECDETNRCVARKDHAECGPGDKKQGKRCRDGVWVDIECKRPEDCKGHEYCDDGLCIDKERGCEVPSDCPAGYYCDFHGSKLPEFHKCERQECRTHEECPVGQGCDINAFGPRDRANARTSCISWNEYHCSDEDPCPGEWVCDAASGKCGEPLCYEGRPCQDGRYKCVDFQCVPKSCNDMEDPLGHCMEQKGWYGRCLGDICVVLSCDSYPDPDRMCQETEGESWYCADKRCVDLGVEGTSDPNANCIEQLGVDEAFWNYDRQSCDVPDCDTVSDPDKLCAQLKDPSYRCREGVCRHGREGEDCEIRADCISGLRCAGGLCMEKECIRWQDCNDPNMWCNHGVCEPLRTDCAGPEDCRDDYHCDAGGQCVPNGCDDHYDCGEGECCTAAKECVRCELVTCFYNFDCRQGWRCNPKTSRCQRVGCTMDSECEEGYYCDLDDGICKKIMMEDYIRCWDDPDCPEGQVCKGAYHVQHWGYGVKVHRGQGICVYPDTELLQIDGVDDDRTCDYCRSMYKKIGKEGEFPLPPYHNHCRCWAEYV